MAAQAYTPSHKVGETIENGKYRLDELLGVGTFGEVWKAMHLTLSQIVAIKILHWRITSKDTRGRFAQEARVSINLGKHPNIVAGRDLIVEENSIAIVMEYIDGGMTLRRFMNEWTPTTREALRIIAAVLEGLLFAHESGVLHRDLKPENILLNPKTNPPTPMVTDFGLAGTSHSEDQGDDRMTKAGTRMGTPGYLAFEQWVDARFATVRSDLFSVGVMLAELLGVPPIATEAVKINESINPEIRNRWLSAVPDDRLRAIVDRATAIEFIEGKIEEKRYSSARAMLTDILAIMKEFPESEARATQKPPRTPNPVGASELSLQNSENKPDLRSQQFSPPTYLSEGEDVVPSGFQLSQEGSDSADSRSGAGKWIGAGIAVFAIIIATMIWLSSESANNAEAIEVSTPTPTVAKAETPTPQIEEAATQTPVVSTTPLVKAETPTPAIVKTPVPQKNPTPVPVATPLPTPLLPTPTPAPQATEATITITSHPAQAKVGDVIMIMAKVTLPEGSAVGSATIRYRGGSGGAWQSKPVQIENGIISSSLAVSAAFGEKVEYYIDLRLASDAGKAKKSSVASTAITP